MYVWLNLRIWTCVRLKTMSIYFNQRNYRFIGIDFFPVSTTTLIFLYYCKNWKQRHTTSTSLLIHPPINLLQKPTPTMREQKTKGKTDQVTNQQYFHSKMKMGQYIDQQNEWPLCSAGALVLGNWLKCLMKRQILVRNYHLYIFVMSFWLSVIGD